MSVPAGWRDDPVSGGRLRYWDGAAWSDWIHADGATAHDPLPAEVPADPGGAPVREDLAPPQAPPVPGEGRDPAGRWRAACVPSRVARIGSGLVGVGGILAMATLDQRLTSQALPGGLSPGYGSTASVFALGLVMLLVGVAGALVINLWLRLACLLVGGVAFSVLAFVAVGSRDGSDLVAHVPVHLHTAWHLLFWSILAGMVGTALVMSRPVEASAPPPPPRAAAPLAGLGVVAGLVGLLLAPLGAVGCMCGRLAAPGTRLMGQRRPRLAAVVAQVLGVATFVLWSIGLVVAMLSVGP